MREGAIQVAAGRVCKAEHGPCSCHGWSIGRVAGNYLIEIVGVVSHRALIVQTGCYSELVGTTESSKQRRARI